MLRPARTATLWRAYVQPGVASVSTLKTSVVSTSTGARTKASDSVAACRESRAAMTRRAECHTLCGDRGIGHEREIGRHQSRDIDQQRGGGGLAGQWAYLFHYRILSNGI